MREQERYSRPPLPPPGAVTVRDQYPPGYGYPPGMDSEPEESSVPLAHYLWILRRHKWRIGGFVLACVFATFIVSSRLTPIFESTVTLDVDRHSPTSVVEEDSAMLANLRDDDQFLATQLKIVQ